MSDQLQPELKLLLEEVVTFLSQLKDPSIQIKANDLKMRLEDWCFDSIDEELYDEATKEEADTVPDLPKTRDDSKGGSGSFSSKGSVKRKSSAGAWQSEDVLIAEVAVSALINATKQGYIEKRRPENNKLAKMLSPYQKRYCAIHEGIFYYFETAASKKQSGAFHIKEYEARPAYHLIKNVSKKEGSFEMVSPGARSFQFLAKDFEEMKEWLAAVDEWSDFSHPDVSTLSRPADAIDKSKDASSGSDSGSISVTGANLDEQAEPDASPGSKARKALPVPQEIYDDAEADQEMYDEAGIASPSAKAAPVLEEIYDEAGIEEETYDAVEEEAPQPAKALPKIPSGGRTRRAIPQPPLPGEPANRPLPPPPPAQKTVTASSEDYENMFYGLWDCETRLDHELSFSSGDIIHIVDKEYENSGWWTGLLNGKIGLVPKSFLTAAYAAA
ncbi:src kinase-associated phosphoprotein 2-like isoform X2 [Watersipora subatra]|uniref:src kinase-associated phosphoprotein 2-like isoform X2 n=1 Tax=Watersipora subatra TaxID=2589382 RepID=UPI00355BB5FE